MGFLDLFRPKNRGQVVTEYKMVSDYGQGFYQWDGKLYKSDIVRACIRPKSRAIGKSVGKHIRRDPVKGLQVNPDAYMRFLLEEPNQYMIGQAFQEKLINQLELNGNAFAWIQRDENGYPMALYPINCSGVQLIKDDVGTLYLKFFVINSKPFTALYSDIIHLRKDFFNDEFFGEPPGIALSQLMEVVSNSDHSVISAIRNSSIVKWLLKFNTTIRREDLEKQAKSFADGFLSTQSTTGGVAAIDAKADAQQIQPQDYVPNAAQTDRTTKRIYAFFNTNEKIVMCDYTENEWISYYETAVEPDIGQLSMEFTRKLFSRRERGFGNAIIFESMNLQFASMQTKLALSAMVDRGAMTPNEWRETLNLAPIPGGDNPIRRLDTAVVGDNTDDGGDENETNSD